MRVEPPTRATSSTSLFAILVVEDALRRRGALEQIGIELLEPRARQRLEVDAVVEALDLDARLVLSTALRALDLAAELLDRRSPLASEPCLRLNTLSRCWITRLSKSSPPRWVSPDIASTSKTPLSIVRSETSKVPPPKSKTRMFFSPADFLSRPYAIAAAVDSLRMRRR